MDVGLGTPLSLKVPALAVHTLPCLSRACLMPTQPATCAAAEGSDILGMNASSWRATCAWTLRRRRGLGCLSRAAQTGKCPTSGGFFALYPALVGGFCPGVSICFYLERS
jgi:hypothetical protein